MMINDIRKLFEGVEVVGIFKTHDVQDGEKRGRVFSQIVGKKQDPRIQDPGPFSAKIRNFLINIRKFLPQKNIILEEKKNTFSNYAYVEGG